MKLNPKYLIFTLLFLAVSIFTLPILEGVRKEIKKEVSHKIKKNLIPIEYLDHFSAEDLQDVKWKKSSKEFFFNAYFYDVVTTYHKNGKLYYVCFKDKKETELVADINLIRSIFKKEISKTDLAFSKPNFVKAKFRYKLGIPNSEVFQFSDDYSHQFSQFLEQKLHLIIFNIDINSPPPEFPI